MFQVGAALVITEVEDHLRDCTISARRCLPSRGKCSAASQVPSASPSNLLLKSSFANLYHLAGSLTSRQPLPTTRPLNRWTAFISCTRSYRRLATTVSLCRSPTRRVITCRATLGPMAVRSSSRRRSWHSSAAHRECCKSADVALIKWFSLVISASSRRERRSVWQPRISRPERDRF